MSSTQLPLIPYDLERLPYPNRLNRTNRRTLGIQVMPDCVAFTAPHKMRLADIYALIEQKAQWITRARAQIADRPRFVAPPLCAGGWVPYRGGKLPIRITPTAKKPLVMRDGNAPYLALPSRLASRIIPAVERVLRREALDYATARVSVLGARFELFPTALVCRHYSARWGSCAQGGEIRLNWQLILAPDAVFDYVIAHELAHLRHMNHGRAFWQLVAQLMPDYKTHRAWLRDNGHILRLQ